MKILLVGASGTIGQAVHAALSPRHEILSASRSGDLAIDITDPDSIRGAFEKAGPVDAVVSTAGGVHFGPLPDMDAGKYEIGLKDKLMGQVNLVLIGRDYVAEGGSFTLTSGILTRDPIRFGSSASMVNGALEAFARAAAIEMTKGHRINVVSPGLLQESAAALGGYFPGHDPVPGKRVALGYAKSVEGAQTGQVFEIF